MKKVLFVLLLTLSSLTNAQTFTVNGIITLEGAETFENINISLVQTSPSTSTTNVSTDEDGAFSAQVDVGIYDITYSRSGFDTKVYESVSVTSDIDMGSVMLTKHVTRILIPAPDSSIQAAIDYSIDGDTIVLDSGRYQQRINFDGKDIIVCSKFFLTGDSIYIDSTIIDANSEGRVVTMTSGESNNARLIGLTLMNGRAQEGGGILIEDSSPSIEFCVLTDNVTTEMSGGGMYVSGIHTDGSSVQIKNCTIKKSYSAHYGGGLHISRCSPLLLNTVIKDNYADYSVGGVRFWGADPTMINCIVVNNNSNGISLSYNDEAIIMNTVIAGNEDKGIAVTSGSTISMINSIVYGDPVHFYGTPEAEEVDLRNNCIYREAGSFEVPGNAMYGMVYQVNENGDSCDYYMNIFKDPAFSDTILFALSDTSPCIDAGVADAYSTDMLGHCRQFDGDGDLKAVPDMGVIEYNAFKMPDLYLSLGKDTTIYEDDTITIHLINEVEIQHYLWFEQGGLELEDTLGSGPMLEVSNAGTYFFTGLYEGCQVTSETKKVRLQNRPADDEEETAVENYEIGNIMVYPNPVDKNLTIQTSGRWNQGNNMVFTIYNLQGQIVYNKSQNLWSESSEINLNTENLQVGNYILIIQSKDQIHRFNFIKE